MDEKFSEKTHKYVRELACEKPTKERERRIAIVQHTKEKIVVKEGKKRSMQLKQSSLQIVLQRLYLLLTKKKLINSREMH